MRCVYWMVLVSGLWGAALRAQTVSDASVRPLPDVASLMREVEAHQKTSEGLVRDYLYHSHAIEQTLDKNGTVKKTETEDADIFYVSGVRLRRVTAKNGKELSAAEQQKEAQRIDKEIEKAKRKQGDPGDTQRDVVTVSRFLELGSFSNARRVSIDGRDTIAVDFTGNPKAKTHTSFEGALREMEGTVWIDEQDRALRKLEGRFINDFKVGGGLLADVRKGSSFAADYTKVNDEVWLPVAVSGRGDIRLLVLMNLHGSLRVVDSNFRKFKATSTILPATNSSGSQP